MQAYNTSEKKSLFETYKRSLIQTTLLFLLFFLMGMLFFLFIFGQNYFKTQLKNGGELAKLICERQYSEFVLKMYNKESLELIEEAKIVYAKRVVEEISNELEKSIPELKIYTLSPWQEKTPNMIASEVFHFEPLNLRLIVGVPNGYLFSWFIIRGLYILIFLLLFISLSLIYQNKLTTNLKKELFRLIKELESGGRLSPLGYLEIDTLISAINKALERERELIEKISAQEKLSALGTFAGGYAHEFNNLLQIASINLELIEKYLKENKCELISSLIQKTSKNLQRGQQLAQKLLYLTKKTETESTHLNELIENLKEPLSVLVSKEIALKINLPKEACLVPLSEEGVKEILVNLVKNAVDAILEKKKIMENFKGQIEVIVERLEDKVILKVRDNGIGMTDEVKKRLFEPFFTTKDVGKGTGLGLYTTYNLVKNASGEIEVNSTYLEGTTFQIVFPLVEIKKDEISEDKGGGAQAGISYKRVLIVDDEEDIREALEVFLRELGLEVRTAGNGLMAWEILQREKFDIMFLDLFMPEEGGDFVLDKLKEGNKASPEIILMTGFAGEMEEKIKENLKEGRIKAILRKPFSLQDIVKILKGDKHVFFNE